MRRSFLRSVARCLAGVLLAAQMAIAAYACPGLSAALGGTASNAGVAAVAERMPGCAGMGIALDPDSANLCAEHCKYGQQSDHASTLTVPTALLTALYTTVPEPPRCPAMAANRSGAPAAAFPPHAILHCVFRI